MHRRSVGQRPGESCSASLIRAPRLRGAPWLVGLIAFCLSGTAWAGIKVAVIGACGVPAIQTDVQSKLQALKLFDKVDSIDASATTPDVPTLQGYDAVVLIADGFRSFANPSAIGDNLAAYVDAGGGVVVMDAYVMYPSGVTGRFATDYNLIDSGGPQQFFGLSLGTKVLPMHPLLTGVNTIAATGSRCLHRPSINAGSIRHTGMIVADWSDTNTLAIASTINGHNRVDLNIWPGSNDVMPSAYGCWDPKSDVPTLIGNAVSFVANPLRATPNPLDFGDVGVGVTNGPQTVSVKNTGTAAVTLAAPMAPGLSDFTATVNGGIVFPFTLNAGASFTFDVKFKPSAPGVRTTTYVFPAGAVGSPSASITLTGNGIGPRFASMPAAVDFGGVRWMGPPRTALINISNVGGGQLQLQSFVLSDTTNFGFVGSPPPAGKILNAGASNDVQIQFTPMAQMLFTSTLTISYYLLPDTMNLKQTVIPIQGSAGYPKIAVASAISLRSVRVGATGLPENVTVTNSGFADLTINGLKFMEGDASDFKVVSSTPIIVPPNGHSFDVQVQMIPTKQGTRAATLHILSDDAMFPDTTVGIDGKGTVANFAIAPMSLDFTLMNTVVQQTGTCSSAQNVTVSNSGSDDLTLLSVGFDGPAASSYTQPIVGTRVVPHGGGQVVIPVQFCPQAIGAQLANLVVTTDFMPGHMVKIPLTGKASGAKVGVDKALVDFGPVYIKTLSKPVTVTVSNTGDKAVMFGAGKVNPNGPVFIATGLPAMGAMLMPGDKLMLTVTAQPTMSIVTLGSIDIPTNDMTLPGGLLKIPLSVTGIQANISSTPKMITFPLTAVGVKSQPVTVTVTNTGAAPLTGMSLLVSGTDLADFGFDGMVPTSLAPNANVTFPVYFKPTANGALMRNAILVINAVGLSVPEQVRLSGTSKMLAISCGPAGMADTLSLGNVSVGNMATGSVVCRNQDSGSVDINATFDDNQADWSVSADNMTIPGSMGGNDGILQLTVTFKPTMAGNRGTSLSITSKDSGGLISSVGVEGMGTMAPDTGGGGGGGCAMGGKARGVSEIGGLLILLLGGLLIRRRRLSS